MAALEVMDRLINLIGGTSGSLSQSEGMKKKIAELNPYCLSSSRTLTSELSLSQRFFNRNGLYVKCIACTGLFAYSASLLLMMAVHKSFTRGYYRLHKLLGRHPYSALLLFAHPEYVLYRNRILLGEEIKIPEFDQIYPNTASLKEEVRRLMAFKNNCLSSAVIESQKRTMRKPALQIDASQSKIKERVAQGDTQLFIAQTTKATSDLARHSKETDALDVSENSNRYSSQHLAKIIRRYPKNTFERD